MMAALIKLWKTFQIMMEKYFKIINISQEKQIINNFWGKEYVIRHNCNYFPLLPLLSMLTLYNVRISAFQSVIKDGALT